MERTGGQLPVNITAAVSAALNYILETKQLLTHCMGEHTILGKPLMRTKKVTNGAVLG